MQNEEDGSTWEKEEVQHQHHNHQHEHQETLRTVTNPTECGICLTLKEVEECLHSLPCSHSLCCVCSDNLAIEANITCPACGARHSAERADQEIIKDLPDTALTQADITRQSPEPGGECVAVANEKQQELPHSSDLLHQCEDMNGQLEEYHMQLEDWKNRHRLLRESLLHLIQKARQSEECVEQEISQVLSLKKEGQRGVSSMQGHLDTLHMVGEAETWMQKCRSMFPNPKTVTASLKVVEAAETVMAAVEEVVQPEGAEGGVTAAPTTLEDPDTTIQQRVEALTPPPPAAIKAQDLRHMTEPTRKQVEAGRIMAVHQRSSRIAVHDGRVYLHTLQDQPPSPSAATLQVSEVVPAALPCLVFLDLAWPGSPPQRVHIWLSPDTLRGRQFLLLCTGLWGPCYQGTRLFQEQGSLQTLKRCHL